MRIEFGIGGALPEEEVLQRVREIPAAVKPLATEYCKLPGGPLGVTGKFAEYVAAKTLGLELALLQT